MSEVLVVESLGDAMVNALYEHYVLDLLVALVESGVTEIDVTRWVKRLSVQITSNLVFNLGLRLRQHRPVVVILLSDNFTFSEKILYYFSLWL